MMIKKLFFEISHLLLYILISTFTYAQTTKDYQIPASVFSGGGGNRMSSNYQQFDALGESVVGSRTSSANNQEDGFIHGGDPAPRDTVYVSIRDTVCTLDNLILYL